MVNIEGDVLAEMVNQISSWNKLLRVISYVLKFVKKMKLVIKRTTDDSEASILTVEDMGSTRDMILQHYQRTEFQEEYRILNGKRNLSKN